MGKKKQEPFKPKGQSKTKKVANKSKKVPNKQKTGVSKEQVKDKNIKSKSINQKSKRNKREAKSKVKKKQPKKKNAVGSFFPKAFEDQLDEYMRQAGYPNYQKHSFKTKDGYTLRFFRIQKKGTQIQNGKKVVYLQHGLLDSSDTWIVNDIDKSPAFILAEKGYDVWLGNTRGNVYSTPALSPEKQDYWNFTFDEMAQYDLPAAFQNINSITNQKIHYIGHSQGTLIMFIALSMRNRIVQRYLASFSACGPVVYLKHIKVKIAQLLINILPKTLLKGVRKLAVFLQNLVGYENFSMPDQFTNSAIDLFMEIKAKLFGLTVGSTIQKWALKQFSDQFIDQVNTQRMPTIFQHYPSGTSLNNIMHFIQYATNGGKFCRFSKQEDSNELYDLRKVRVTVPVHLFVGAGDMLATLQDAKDIFVQIGASNKKMIVFDRFGHSSFMWGKNTKELIDKIQRDLINA